MLKKNVFLQNSTAMGQIPRSVERISSKKWYCRWLKSGECISQCVWCCSTRNILDDFREAYYWLRQNTDDKARVMSWWDYGYQIAGMGNRTTLVDNNTWNNSHIALVSIVCATWVLDGPVWCNWLDGYIMYRVGQIKWHHFTFLLVTNECINKILWFLAQINYIKQQIAWWQFYVNEWVTR